MKKQKACKLSLSTRQRIGNFKDKNPAISIVDIANKFNCSYEQARKAIADYKAGILNKKPAKLKKPVIEDFLKNPADDNLEYQYNYAVASLRSEILPAETNILLLDKLFTMKKKIQSINLEKHLKRPDAALIASIIRKYEPEASNDRVIEVYHEVLTLIKGDV